MEIFVLAKKKNVEQKKLNPVEWLSLYYRLNVNVARIANNVESYILVTGWNVTKMFKQH